LANSLNEAGKKLLAIETTEDEKKEQKKNKEQLLAESPDKDRPSDHSHFVW
jgi:Ethanolamine utilization protein EutJ (predicted chaperonin)